MANSINWGKIYESTWWGLGVTSNTISWGDIYYDFIFNILIDKFEARILADGGTAEGLSCVNRADFVRPYNWTYYFRVVDDGGIVESLECVTI